MSVLIIGRVVYLIRRYKLHIRTIGIKDGRTCIGSFLQHLTQLLGSKSHLSVRNAPSRPVGMRPAHDLVEKRFLICRPFSTIFCHV